MSDLLTIEDLERVRSIETTVITHLIVCPKVAAAASEIGARLMMGKPLTRRALRHMRGRARAARKRS